MDRWHYSTGVTRNLVIRDVAYRENQSEEEKRGEAKEEEKASGEGGNEERNVWYQVMQVSAPLLWVVALWKDSYYPLPLTQRTQSSTFSLHSRDYTFTSSCGSCLFAARAAHTDMHSVGVPPLLRLLTFLLQSPTTEAFTHSNPSN